MTPGSVAEISPNRRAVRRSTVVIVAVWAALSLPFILSGFVKGRGAWDQLNYHEQVVRTFAEQLPSPDYSNYLSATTPGYHTVLAVVCRVVSDERVVLQLTGALFTVGLLVLLVRGARGSALLALPVVVSMPVFYSGVWMLPDNAGWLGVLAVWLLALRPRFDRVTVIGGGAALALLILFRQIHLWPWALLLAAAWLGSSDSDGVFDLVQDLRELFAGVWRRLARVGVAVAAGLPAVAVLLWFWSHWGRTLTPPVFDTRHVGGNPTAPAFVLAVFGMYGVFFVPFVTGGLRRLWERQTWLLALAAGAGLGLALAAPTTWSTFEGRYSGLWDIARRFPAPLDRSVVVTPLAVVGAVLVAAWFVTLGRRDRWLMLGALVAFTAAQCASFKLWQRYSEPMVLVWLALAAARVPRARSAAGEGWRSVGVLSLSAGLALVTAASLWFAGSVRPRELLFPGETAAPVLPGMALPPRDRGDRGHEGGGIDRSRQVVPGERSAG